MTVAVVEAAVSSSPPPVVEGGGHCFASEHQPDGQSCSLNPVPYTDRDNKGKREETM